MKFRSSFLALILLTAAGATAQVSSKSSVSIEPQETRNAAAGQIARLTPLDDSGGVPRMIKLSGTLRDAQGKPRDGVTGILFSIYTRQTGGSAVWTESQSAQLDSQGRYSVLLGSERDNGLPRDIFNSGEARWVGVQALVDGEPEQPRSLLVSVPYSLKAGDAETLGGRPASAYQLADGAKSATGVTPLSGKVNNQRFCANGATGCTNPASTLNGTTNNIAKFSSVAGELVNSAIFESSGKVGINNTSPLQTLDINGTMNLSGSAQIGGRLLLAPSTAASAGLSLPAGPNPTSPLSGDIWNLGSALQFRDNGSTSLTHTLADLDSAQTFANKTFSGSSNTFTNIATSSLTGILPIANGGTGSVTQNFVDLTTDQLVSGMKTFRNAYFNLTNPQDNGLLLQRSAGATTDRFLQDRFLGGHSNHIYYEWVMNPVEGTLNNTMTLWGDGGNGGAYPLLSFSGASFGGQTQFRNKYFNLQNPQESALSLNYYSGTLADQGIQPRFVGGHSNHIYYEWVMNPNEGTQNNSMTLWGDGGNGGPHPMIAFGGIGAGGLTQIENDGGGIRLNDRSNAAGYLFGYSGGASPTQVWQIDPSGQAQFHNGVNLTKTNVPSIPPAGSILFYADSTTGNASCINSAGGNCLPTGSVAGVVGIANGGTGSATQNFVDLTTDQIVTGQKTLKNKYFNLVNPQESPLMLNQYSGTLTDQSIQPRFLGGHSNHIYYEWVMNPNEGTTANSLTLWGDGGNGGPHPMIAFGGIATGGLTQIENDGGGIRLNDRSNAAGYLFGYSGGASPTQVWQIDPSGQAQFHNGVNLTKTAAPGNPPNGTVLLYADATTGNVNCLTSTGGACLAAATAGNALTLNGKPDSAFEQVANKNGASGYAGLDATSRIAQAQAPVTTAYTDATNTFSKKQGFQASTTASASLNVATGVAPTTPVAGDVWSSGSNMLFFNGTGNKTMAFTDSALTGDGSGLQNLNAANLTTGVIGVARGGTGSTTQNFVDLSSVQTIAGAKTFSSTVAASVSGTSANVTGVVAAVNGGTGLATAPTAAGQYLRSTSPGTWSAGTMQPQDLPSKNFVFAADTGSLKLTGGTSGPSAFLDVNFGSNLQIDGWTHAAGTATFQATQQGTYLVQYTVQFQTDFSSPEPTSILEVQALIGGSVVLGSGSAGQSEGSDLPVVAVSKSFIAGMNANDVLKLQWREDVPQDVALVAGGGTLATPTVALTIMRIQ